MDVVVESTPSLDSLVVGVMFSGVMNYVSVTGNPMFKSWQMYSLVQRGWYCAFSQVLSLFPEIATLNGLVYQDILDKFMIPTLWE